MINLISGPICSGKSTWIKNDMRPDTDRVIVVSDVVRDIVKSNDRRVLQDTAEMAGRIADKITSTIKSTDIHNDWYVDGIRQVEIIERLVCNFGFYNTRLKWIDPGLAERELRYNLRNAEKDKSQNFHQAEIADNKLGVENVKMVALAWASKI